MANLNLNTDELPEGQGFEPIPAGKYPAHVVDSEVAATKSGTGMMLKLTWEIVDGQYQNRKIFQNINFQNQSAQAEQIGRSQIRQICDAVGIKGHLGDSEELHFKPCLIGVVIKNDPSGQYEPKNEVKIVKALSGASGLVAANDNKPQAQRAPQTATAANDNVPQQTAAPQQAIKSNTGASGGSRPWR